MLRWASWVNFVVGVWLIVAAFALARSMPGAAAPNDVIVGILIAALSLWMAAMFTPPAIVDWIVVALGAWMVIASFVLRNGGQPMVGFANELVAGAIVFILALLRAVGVGRRLEAR